MNKYNSVVIAGPTASGKTSIAVKVAANLDGEILSADSRQVYRGMDIGTGKDLNEYVFNGKKIRYHLIDIADPKEKYTLYNYQRDFYSAFDELLDFGKLPVICGGTGLYIESVLKDYKISSVPEDEQFRNTMMRKDKSELLSLLEKYPEMFNQADVSSKKRIVRALEIAKFKEETTQVSPERRHFVEPLICVLMIEREALKRRISTRLHQRLDEGMVDEVSNLLESGVSPERMIMFGMEYKLLTRYLLGELKYDEMVSLLETEIFRLAKRQRTWFRGMERRGISINVFTDPDHDQIIDFVKNQLM